MKEKTKKCLLSMKRGKAEIIALILYVIGVSVISYFHEPWFDEAQAWQIARCASIKDILFQIPHYEGHPPLWHLVLAPFAKFGAPYEFTLSAINITFCTAAVALILFKSPFPKIVRCLIPFSYFFFYQYGVISRPYSMMMLAFVLMAITYTNRNNKPLLYVLSLGFLCLTQAFGIIIAGGLSLVWVWEIFIERKREKTLKELFKDKRCWCLFGLAVLAGFLIISIIPAEDVYYAGVDEEADFFFKKLLTVFIAPIDCLFGTFWDVETVKQTLFGLVISCIIGALILVILSLIMYANKKLLTFLLPYMMYLVFGSLVYFSIHHIGISLFYFVFIFWILLSGNTVIKTPGILRKVYTSISSKAIKKSAVVITALTIIMPFAWTICSSYNDIKYCFGVKNVVEFLKNNNLDKRKIMAQWATIYNIDESFSIWENSLSQFDDTSIRQDYTDLCGLASATLPYFDENIYMNFNADDKNIMYMRYRKDSNPEINFKKWHDLGLPEVIIGNCTLNKIYSEDELKNIEYVRVAELKSYSIWKFSRREIIQDVFIRKDLLGEYPSLKEVKY